MLIAEAEFGERIMQALILRRVGLIETGTGGPVLIGPAMSPDLVRLQGFLARNASPHRVLDPADDHEAAALLERYALNASDLPLVVCANGSVLKNPTEVDLARALGMVRVASPSAIIRCSSSTRTATASPPRCGRATSTVRMGGTRCSFP